MRVNEVNSKLFHQIYIYLYQFPRCIIFLFQGLFSIETKMSQCFEMKNSEVIIYQDNSVTKRNIKSEIMYNSIYNDTFSIDNVICIDDKTFHILKKDLFTFIDGMTF